MQRVLHIEFYYDVGLRDVLLNFQRYRVSKTWNMKIVYKPFFLGGVMQSTGNKPPALLPARGAYMMKDFERCGNYNGIKLQLPSNFPANTISSMRLLTVINSRAPRYLEPLRYWSQNLDITTPESLLESCTGVGIPLEEAQGYVSAIQDPEIKETLRLVTEEAVTRGAFGAPTFFVRREGDSKDEMFFGSDRFPILAHFFSLPWFGPFPSERAKL